MSLPRIDVIQPLRQVNERLLELLGGLSETDWARPTVHVDRDVKDLTAHLLHGSLRRVTAIRDNYHRPTPTMAGVADLTAFIQRDNREFILGMRRVSPAILLELIVRYDAELVRLLEALDPGAPGLGVAWAGEEVSANWFDVAREYTEKWHHQQQLRDATGRPSLHDRGLFEPALQTFARGLPWAYRGYTGGSVTITLTGPVPVGWTLHRSDGWQLTLGAQPDGATALTLDADIAWRVWTKGLAPEDARHHVAVRGDTAAVEPLLRFVAIMA